ncbi:NAD(P)-dependent oxidoreductase [Microbulbifer sp. CnH-101-G]|uniref:NAD(P)-dependent oxidoreductase n=1 Tax=Microbulbifer sp. CnH-101-G TaxID=3243393 RepID=UPI00403A1FDC
MKVTIFGASGNVGSECLKQCLEENHEVTALIRTPQKIPQELRTKATLIKGDGLKYEDVESALFEDTDAILFAVGVDEKTSPRNLCTDITENILTAMKKKNISRLIWCGGGSNLLPEDTVSFGAKFVNWYAKKFLQHRHLDKENQLSLLNRNKDINWIGIRPLQMVPGPKTTQYRLGFNKFGPLSKISYADCAHAMVKQLTDDTWINKSPIIQY